MTDIRRLNFLAQSFPKSNPNPPDSLPTIEYYTDSPLVQWAGSGYSIKASHKYDWASLHYSFGKVGEKRECPWGSKGNPAF